MLRLVPWWVWIAGAVLVLAGVIVAAVSDGTGDAVGFAAGGTGAILLVGALFFAVGRSEDVDRERHPHG